MDGVNLSRRGLLHNKRLVQQADGATGAIRRSFRLSAVRWFIMSAQAGECALLIGAPSTALVRRLCLGALPEAITGLASATTGRTHAGKDLFRAGGANRAEFNQRSGAGRSRECFGVVSPTLRGRLRSPAARPSGSSHRCSGENPRGDAAARRHYHPPLRLTAGEDWP